jgi:hypothetical protein
MLFIDFATRKEAEKALKLKGALIAGRRAIFSLAKPPLKYTASWETRRSTGHYGDRDGGSAVGTNFEEVQEQIYRKWILGHKDRKVGQTLTWLHKMRCLLGNSYGSQHIRTEEWRAKGRKEGHRFANLVFRPRRYCIAFRCHTSKAGILRLSDKSSRSILDALIKLILYASLLPSKSVDEKRHHTALAVRGGLLMNTSR